jgi:2Fe-2S ferredoxin
MKVRFVPLDVEHEILPNQTVLQVANENGISIKSVCNGMPSCAECRVRLVEGEANVLPPGVKELNLIGTGYFIDQRRLSCQMLCFGDITVDLAEQIEKAKESVSSRKFLAKQKDVVTESHAVSGNLIEQDAEFQSVAETKPQPKQQNRPRQDHRNRR